MYPLCLKNHFHSLGVKKHSQVTCQYNKLKVIRSLVAGKANINKGDSHGFTALMLASKLGYLPIVKFLIQSKAKVDKVSDYGETALVLAIEEKQSQVAKFLIESKAAPQEST